MTRPDEIYYMSKEEKLVIAIDVGNSFSSITMAHLRWNDAPLSRSSASSPAMRTVLNFPGSTSPLAPVPTRTPTMMYYDSEDHPCAHGAVCLTLEAMASAKAEGWTLVKLFKDQFRPRPLETNAAPTQQDSKRRLRKSKTSPQLMSGSQCGPKLQDIWGDYLTYLVAAARADFAENYPHGESTFDRLWLECEFVIPHPADWTSQDIDLVREAMIRSHLVSRETANEQIVFVSESLAAIHFVERHTDVRFSDEPFIVCDAAELGVTLVGYRGAPQSVFELYDSSTRIDAGVRSVRQNLQELLAQRHGSKIDTSRLLDEFVATVLPSYAGPGAAAVELFEFRFGVTTVKAKPAQLMLTAEDIEMVVKPSIDAIIVRLSAIVARGAAKHILLVGGFAESPYLINRVRETFESREVRVITPRIPAHTAISEGALRLYLSQRLAPRKTRYHLGFEVAVDADSDLAVGRSKRDIFNGSGGSRLVKGKFSCLLEAGQIPTAETPSFQPYHLRYRLASRDRPIFTTLLWAYDPALVDGYGGWMYGTAGDLKKGYRPVCRVMADLTSLVAISDVHDAQERAFVCLDFNLVIAVGKTSLETTVVWRGQDGKLSRGPAAVVPDDFF